MDIILFGDSRCPACVAQIKLLNAYFKKPLSIKYYDLGKKPPPSFLLDSKKNYSMPTWYFPTINGRGVFIKGIIQPKKFEKYIKISKNGFGIQTNFNQLEKYGKNFDTGGGFKIQNSWENTLTKKWGNPLDSGTLGRELGPGKNIYSNAYYNDIRMAVPGGDLSEVLYTNRNCNIINNPKAATEMTGLIYDSKNPQLVANQFGKLKNKSNFGNLYSQMGPSYSNEKLINNPNFNGATQSSDPRPSKVNNKNMYIGQFPTYKPLNVGEGSELVIVNNKIKKVN
uniref:Thioredoxin-like fold domain-containing protein n=1 Tax=viral metagenome TaxID=1070528 RepID=A0A6C0I7Y8_9ZZZZ